MSTHESIATRDASLVTSRAKVATSQPAHTGLLSWRLFHKLAYLGGDFLAITLAHMLTLRIVEHFLHVSESALRPFEYYRFYIPFFAVVLYLFDGYKSPELRRPEHELERSCKAVSVSFLGLVL